MKVDLNTKRAAQIFFEDPEDTVRRIPRAVEI
jgi:hypothetical protein